MKRERKLYQRIKLAIINNPGLSCSALAGFIGVDPKDVWICRNELNISSSSKPKHCRG